jgi:hypothetical protein
MIHSSRLDRNIRRMAAHDVSPTELMRPGLRIAVGIPTAGRRLILADTLAELARQTRFPETVLICPAAADDFDASQAAKLPFPVQIVEGSRGLPMQRNAILGAAQQFDVVIFFDDDFFPEPTYLAELEDCGGDRSECRGLPSSARSSAWRGDPRLRRSGLPRSEERNRRAGAAGQGLHQSSLSAEQRRRRGGAGEEPDQVKSQGQG